MDPQTQKWIFLAINGLILLPNLVCLSFWVLPTCKKNLVTLSQKMWKTTIIENFESLTPRRDLEFWLSRSPINRVLSQGLYNGCTKFGENQTKTFWVIAVTSFFGYLTPVTLTFDLWPQKRVGDKAFILGTHIPIYDNPTYLATPSKVCDRQTARRTDRQTDIICLLLSSFSLLKMVTPVST